MTSAWGRAAALLHPWGVLDGRLSVNIDSGPTIGAETGSAPSPATRAPRHRFVRSPQTAVILVGASCHLSGPSLSSWEGFLWAQVAARRCRTNKFPRGRGCRNTREQVLVETPSPQAPKGSTIRRSVVKVVKSKLLRHLPCSLLLFQNLWSCSP